jgi:hypothetical protein
MARWTTDASGRGGSESAYACGNVANQETASNHGPKDGKEQLARLLKSDSYLKISARP